MTGKEAFNLIFGDLIPMPPEGLTTLSMNLLFDAIDKVEKELKALEIIKEKGNFISPEYDENRNKYYIYDNENYEHNEITQEKYELLKEIL